MTAETAQMIVSVNVTTIEKRKKMTDDIVTRLRGQVACDHDRCEDCDLLADAADEIERLRNILIGIAMNKQVWKGFNYDR